MIRSLRSHWPEYLCEFALLGLLMMSAGAIATFLFHPWSPAFVLVPNLTWHRPLMGLGMAITVAALVFSPLGKRSGAHMNPSVTLAYTRLGKVRPWDAVFYIIAQFAGAAMGLFLLSLTLGDLLGHPAVKYVVTRPGTHGQSIAFAAEFTISFVMFTTVLWTSNTPRIARWTGLFAACLVLTYVTFEAPLSGPSMNPARSTASALVSHLFEGLWIYFTAPVLGMQLAAALFCRADRIIYCAKLHHHNNARCIFDCAFGQLAARELGARPTVLRKVSAAV